MADIEIEHNPDMDYCVKLGNKAIAIYLSDIGKQNRVHIREMVVKANENTGTNQWTYTQKAVMIPIDKVPEFVSVLTNFLKDKNIESLPENE